MSSFAASDNIPYSIPSSPSSYLDYPRPTHSYGLRPRVPALRGYGGRPALRSTRAVANAPVVQRPGPTRRPAPARQPNRQPTRRGPARGNRRAPAVSPAISAVRGINSGRLRNNRYVLTPVQMSLLSIELPTKPHTNVFIISHHLPQPGHTSKAYAPSPNRPPSPTWADVLRNPAPNQDSPLFRFEVPDTPGLQKSMDIPEPEAPPFLIGQAALDDIFKYLQGNDAAAELGPEPEAQPLRWF
ncbi:hypothetical protein KEM48_007988 [Puccinia striiformis f. sp. tritici PST-130]|nr:hypothetical protein KEM48_007988 [Puccinia striiformis f. sp. tritici PST-130]